MLKKTCIRKKRRGMILLVVVAFLAMFMVMGTTYILLADAYRKTSEQDLAGTDKRTAFAQMPDVDKRYLLNHFLGQLIYDCEDFFYNKIDEDNKNPPGPYQKYISNTDYRPNPYYGYIQNPPSLAAPVHPDLFSALRGHSLARNMYGGVGLRQIDNLHWVRVSEKPYSGTGRLSSNSLTLTHQNGATDVISEPNFLNYTFFNSLGILSQLSPVDPEKNQHSLAQSKISSFGVGYNSPDFNSPFLGKYSWNVTKVQTTAVSNELIWDVTGQSKLLGPGDNIYIPYPRNLGLLPLTTNIQSINPVPPGSDLNKLLVTLGGPINALISPGTELLVFKLDFVPSFYRNGFGPTNLASVPAASNAYAGNPNWFNSAGKYMLLRPRPYDNLVPADAASVALMPLQSQADLVNLRIQENKLFPYPEADGLDVKNLEGYPGGNDSIWMDVGFPVMKTADGRKYKALIAPFILDLDGKVNLNVAGNLMFRNPANLLSNGDHASNQGWGRWEINPKKLIENFNISNQYSPLIPRNEFLNSLTWLNSQSGGLKIAGRFYENNLLPLNSYPGINNVNPPQTSTFNRIKPHSYAMVDFNGAGDFVKNEDPNPMAVPRYTTTGGGRTNRPTYLNNSGFPTFVSGFSNGYAYEIDPTTQGPAISNKNNSGMQLIDIKLDVPNEHFVDAQNPLASNYHSRNFNPYRSQFGIGGIASNVFSVNETAAVLRWQAAGAPFESSKLGMLMPKSLGLDLPYEITSTEGMFRFYIRNLITTLSADLERPAITPIDVDPGYKTNGSNAVGDFPKRSIEDVPNPVINQTSPGLKLDLNRNLRAFPSYDSNATYYSDLNSNMPGVIPAKSFKQAISEAVSDRQSLAQDIFTNLKNVTAFNGVDASTNRWFAQLAVNIVDYIDEDDFSTSFMFAPNEYVFGIELPRLVINEVFLQVKNNKDDDFEIMVGNNKKYTATKPYDVNTFIEFKNPLPQDANYDSKPGSHKAILQVQDGGGNKSLYRIALNKRGKFWNQPPMAPSLQPTLYEKLSEPGNFYGKYDFTYTDPMTMVSTVPLDVSVVQNWGNFGPKVIDAGGKFIVSSNLAFKADVNGVADPAKVPFNTDFQSADLDLTLPKNFDVNTLSGEDFPTIILQKLALPWLPEQSDPSKPDFNPYLIIDSYCVTQRKIRDNDIMDPGKIKNDPNDPFAKPFMDRREVDNQQYDAYTKNTPNNMKFVAQNDLKSTQRNNSYLDSGVMPPDKASPPFQPYVMPNEKFFNGRNSAFNNQTIGNDNNNLQQPLVTFLDRKLVNPVELIYVPCCKPHEFTQMMGRWRENTVPSQNPGINYRESDTFNRVGNLPAIFPGLTYPYAHNWPWFDESTRLYRFLAVAGLAPLQAGEAMHGRSVGRVNLNTIPDEMVFQAISDPASIGESVPTNWFDIADVSSAFSKMKTNKLVLDFGSPNFVDNTTNFKYGLNRTLLGYLDSTKSFDNILDNPKFQQNEILDMANNLVPSAIYARKEMLTKIYNSTTSRSNVFAIWVTTGYFEVTDDSTYPPKLGAEIGKSDGVNIRHKIFTIVDRTNLISFKNNNLNLNFLTHANGSIADPFGNTLSPIDLGKPILQNPADGTSIGLADGMIVTLDVNTDWEETLEVKLDVNGNFKFNPTKLHNPFLVPAISPNPAYFSNTIKTICIRGNPGPWKGYDYKNDTQVVPYVEFIE